MAGMIRGAGSERAAEPNVIPMIDVLLVLLVIFMIANIRWQHAIDIQVPPVAAAAPEARPTQIVLELLPGEGYTVNGQPVTDAELDRVLGQVFAGRPVKLLFVKAAGGRSYQEVVHAMDRAKGAGVEVIAVVPRAAAAWPR